MTIEWRKATTRNRPTISATSTTGKGSTTTRDGRRAPIGKQNTITRRGRQGYWDEEEEDEYYEFDNNNNRRCISCSDVMKNTYIVVNPCYWAKGWKQNNRWIKNSDGLPLAEDWDDAFKKKSTQHNWKYKKKIGHSKKK